MMGHMKHRVLAFVLGSLLPLVFPMVAMAADEDELPDARLLGYKGGVKVEGGATAVTWLLLVVLALVCLASLFKNAKRTHLD